MPVNITVNDRLMIKEILSQYDSDKKETGIISPYRDQVNAIQKEIPDVETATVHKFQEKRKTRLLFLQWMI